MKRLKILAILTAITVMSALTSCNKIIIDTTYSFDQAVIYIGGEWKTVEIAAWKDYEGEQIQIEAKDGTIYLVHANNCTLIAH